MYLFWEVFNPCTAIVLNRCSHLSGTSNAMQNFKTLETDVLTTMLIAHSAYPRRGMTKKELIACKLIVSKIQLEIQSRNKRVIDVTGKS